MASPLCLPVGRYARLALALWCCPAFVRAQHSHPCRFCPPEPEWVEAEGSRQLQDAPASLVVDLGSRRQTLQAWGTSLCWWANGVGGWGGVPILSELLDLIFSNFTADSMRRAIRNGDGLPMSLGLTQVRYNIGGGEAPEHMDFMRPGGAVEGYQAANGSWNWQADATQRRVLVGALWRGVNLVHAFSNSPPAWMTQSGSATGARKGGSNLKPGRYDDFAKYLAVVVKQFATNPTLLRGRTLVFDAVTPINEPNADWWKFGNNQEGCHFSPKEQSTILAKLDSQLKAIGVTGTPISAAEENWVDGTNRSVAAYSDDVVRKLQLVTTHTYGASEWARPALAHWAAAHGKTLWNSEFGTGSGPLQGGLSLAMAIVADLTHLNCTVWTLWQAVDLDNDLGPSGWGGIAATYPPHKPDFKIRKQYYSFKQFTAFIRPGSTLLSVNISSEDVHAVAALLPMPWGEYSDGPSIVLVAANVAPTAVHVPVTFKGVPKKATVKHVSLYLTDATHDCLPVSAPAFKSHGGQLVLPPESISTLVVDLADPKEEAPGIMV